MNPWWGEYTLDAGQLAHWRVGPSSLWVERRAREWRLTHEEGEDRLDGRLEVQCPIEGESAPDSKDMLRFAPARDSDALLIHPIVPDRPVVTRPDIGFFVLGGEEIEVFVSVPVWLVVRTAVERPPMLDVPTYRLSDTWFGPSTMSGELCYASQTSARLQLLDLPRRPNRAITKIVLRNTGDKGLRVERMNLPAPHLGLFADESCALWTQAVVVECESGSDSAEVELIEGAPTEAAGAIPVAEPRNPRSSNRFARAWDGLLR